MTNLLPLTEIVGAAASSLLNDEQVKAFTNDPTAFLKSNLDVDMPYDISVVENTENEVHLALPYFQCVNDFHASAIHDESLDDISGGEIFITICTVAGVVAGGIICATTTISITAGVGLCIGLGAAGAAVGIGAASGAAVAAVRHGSGEDIHGNKK